VGNKNSGGRSHPGVFRAITGRAPQKLKTQLHLAPMFAEAGQDFDIPPEEVKGNPDAVAEWNRILPIMRDAGALTEAERPALIAACLEWARYLEAHRAADSLNAEAMQLEHNALKLCKQLWIELGMTPRSRSRIQPALQQAKEAVAKWAV